MQIRQQVVRPKREELLRGDIDLREAVTDDLLDVEDALRVIGRIPHHQVSDKDIIQEFAMLRVFLL